jgi:hypothetical protein
MICEVTVTYTDGNTSPIHLCKEWPKVEDVYTSIRLCDKRGKIIGKHLVKNDEVLTIDCITIIN